MSVRRRLVRVGLAGGVVYLSYNLGLWKSADETIANYEQHKKKVDAAYHKLPPSVTHFMEDKARFAKQKTIDPVSESASSFHKKWLDFDYSWMESEDGIVKPAWNKGVAVVCDFIAHLPENTVDLSVKGWKKVGDYMNDTSAVTDSVAQAQKASAASSSKEAVGQ